MSDILVPKGQEQRLRRKLESFDKWKARHNEAIPRYEHTVNGINEQQKQETLLLRQRFLEPKAKKSSKKADKKAQQPSTESPTTGPTGPKVSKRERQCEEIDLTGQQNGPENYEPPAKVPHCNGGPSSSTFKKSKAESSMAKFSLEISHQGQVTGTPGNNHRNGSPVPNHIGSSKPPSTATTPTSIGRTSAPTTPTPTTYPSNTLNVHLKQENSHVSAFADLDQCAAALEKDGASSMSLIEGTSDGLIPSDTLKDLISEISDLNPDFMGDFDFDEDRGSLPQSSGSSTNHGHHNFFVSHSQQAVPVAPVTPSSTTSSPRHVKMESGDYPNSVDSGRGHCSGPSPAAASTASPLASAHPSQTPPYAAGIFETSASSSPIGANHPTSGSSTPNPTYCPQTTTPPAAAVKPTRIPYTSPTPMGHDSPAAQTLKQMAEHHQLQHKQLGMGGNFKSTPPQNHPSPARSPFAADSYSPFTGDFQAQGQQFSNVRNQSDQSVMIKQENQGQGIYGQCPNYPTSPMDMNPLGKRAKSPGTVMGHSKSFTQAHLNPHLPPTYRPSFSPPTSFSPTNQTNYTQHKMNQPQQIPMQCQQNSAGLQQVIGGQPMGMREDMKGGGGMLPHHHGLSYYQNMGLEGGYSSPQDQGQTINFTQQHLRMTQGGPPAQQQPMGRMMGLSPPAQQPQTNQIDRSRIPPRLPSGGMEMGGMSPMDPLQQHRMVMRGEGMIGAQGSEMMGRFNPGSSTGPGRPAQQGMMPHRQQAVTPPYHHQQMTHQPIQQHHMRRLSSYHQSPDTTQRISNQTIPLHQDSWHSHQAQQEQIERLRPFNSHRPTIPTQLHLVPISGQGQQQNMSYSQQQHHHHHMSYPPQQQSMNQSLKLSQSQSLSFEMKNGGSGEPPLVLKTETESTDFNLDLLEGMGEDFSFDPSSNYQNILDSL